MASSSTLSCAVASMDSSTLNLRDESSSSSSDRRPGFSSNRRSFSLPAPISTIDTFRSNHQQQSGPFTSRSDKGVVISGFVIAATTAVGLSFCSLDCFAMAAEVDVSSATVISVASVHSSPNSKPSSNPNISTNLNLILNPNPIPTSDLGFSMAIPVPHEEVWFFVQNGFIAPLPHSQEHGLAIPLSPPREAAVVTKGFTLTCPQWTPSEFEMVLPDFHGRPKPFPRQGRHWSASFVVKGMDGQAFLQLSNLKDDLELNENHEKTSTAAEPKKNRLDKEGKRSLLKVLGMEKFKCFSM
eukprot:c15404_g2_i1 orf=165-1058(+)